jgi:hypothetical protein
VPVTSMPNIAAMSLRLSLRMILLLPMLKDSYFPVDVSSYCFCVLQFKVYPLAWHFKGNCPVKLCVGCLFPIYVNCCVVMFTKVLICLKTPFDNPKRVFLHTHLYISCIICIIHWLPKNTKLPCAHYLLVLLPQSEKWLVLVKFTNQLEFIRQDCTREETWLTLRKRMLSSALNWLL